VKNTVWGLFVCFCRLEQEGVSNLIGNIELSKFVLISHRKSQIQNPSKVNTSKFQNSAFLSAVHDTRIYHSTKLVLLLYHSVLFV